MREVYIASDNIITSLGFTTDENAEQILKGITGIRAFNDSKLAPGPFFASLVDSAELKKRISVFDDPENFTRFEQLALCSVREALAKTSIDFKGKKTLFILSSTKGNIDLLEKEQQSKFERERVFLWHTAALIAHYYGFYNPPLVISNACISGLQAIITASRLIREELYDTVIVNGTDIVSEFVLSGFNSFKSMSNGPCRPFDKTRDGLSLGEGSGTVVLTSDPDLVHDTMKVAVSEGFSSNDANHISGPSRTGEGLYRVIKRTMEHFPDQPEYISAHGTATLYNDEMESIAITRAGLQHVPVNSFKGYWGHTLGAAGVIESIMSVYSIKNKLLINTLGYSKPGVTNPVSVINKNSKKEIKSCLKIASGFGGCNAALVFYKK